MNAIVKMIAVPALSFRRLFGLSVAGQEFKKKAAKTANFQKVEASLRFQEEAKMERLNLERMKGFPHL